LRTRGQPTTVREIGLEIGVASSCTVQRHLDALERKGFIKRDRYKYRSIELADTPYPLITRAVNVPILGSIAAGAPILANEHIEDTFALPLDIVGDDKIFMLRVRGDSMINAGIFDGDLVAIRQQATARNGEIVAALVEDEEATVKRFHKDGRQVRLLAENDAYPPIVSDSIRILGKVILSIHQFS